MKFNCESDNPTFCGLPDSSSLLEGDRLCIASLTGSMDEVIIQTRRKDSVFIEKLRTVLNILLNFQVNLMKLIVSGSRLVLGVFNKFFENIFLGWKHNVIFYEKSVLLSSHRGTVLCKQACTLCEQKQNFSLMM